MTLRSFDPIWEEKYASGHSQKYPWDMVVTFVYRNRPQHKPPQETHILEVGCGTASNLWFAAREGFKVAGIDASVSAIAEARRRFQKDGLQGQLEVGDFTSLPFNNDTFDLVIDRASLTCCGFSSAKKSVSEIRRVLKTGGRFFFNPYSSNHSSFASGYPGDDGLTIGIDAGTLVGAGQICFYDRREIYNLFADGWKILSIQHAELSEEKDPSRSIHADWRVIAEKV